MKPLSRRIIEASHSGHINAANDRQLADAVPDLLEALMECSKLLDAVINSGNCAKFADATGGLMGNILTPAAKARTAIQKATIYES